MDVLEQVLRWIQAGDGSFKPASNSAEDIQKFQDVAQAVIHANKQGLIGDCRPLFESETGRRQCILVVVLGGLTYSGKKYLEDIDLGSRTIPEPLADVMYGLPTSGDVTTDELLRQAIDSFRKSEVNHRKAAVEKLWDAWERLKTVLDPEIKVGNRMLLDIAADEPKFRELLEQDSKQLFDAGNAFHIRHFKTVSTEITRIEHYDYLFHRLLALMNLILVSRRQKLISS